VVWTVDSTAFSSSYVPTYDVDRPLPRILACCICGLGALPPWQSGKGVYNVAKKERAAVQARLAYLDQYFSHPAHLRVRPLTRCIMPSRAVTKVNARLKRLKGANRGVRCRR
jgi:hypothetical protein